MQSRTRQIAFLAAFLGTTFLVPTDGRGQAWMGPGDTVVAEEGSENTYEAAAASFKFGSANTGVIHGYLDVTNPQADGTSACFDALEVVYRDQDGPGIASRVQVLVRQVSNATGESTTVVSLDSNDFPAQTAGQLQYSPIPASLTSFDFEAYAFVVDVEVDRAISGSSNDPGLYIVLLTQSISSPCPADDESGEVEEDSGSSEAPAASGILSLEPNPFTRGTTITYNVAREGSVILRIFDVHGRLVRSLVEGTQAAGHYAVGWDGRNDRGLSSGHGIYFVRFRGPEGVLQSRKLALSR